MLLNNWSRTSYLSLWSIISSRWPCFIVLFWIFSSFSAAFKEAQIWAWHTSCSGPGSSVQLVLCYCSLAQPKVAMPLLTTAFQQFPLTLPRPVPFTSRGTWKLGQILFFFPSESVCGSKLHRIRLEPEKAEHFYVTEILSKKQLLLPPDPLPFSFHANEVVCDPLINLSLIWQQQYIMFFIGTNVFHNPHSITLFRQ